MYAVSYARELNSQGKETFGNNRCVCIIYIIIFFLELVWDLYPPPQKKKKKKKKKKIVCCQIFVLYIYIYRGKAVNGGSGGTLEC